MKKKGVIIGNFVKKNRILSFLEMLKTKYKVNLNKIFVYSIETNELEYLVTFKTYDKDRIVAEMNDSTVLHVKNGCIFSINALNLLIETKYKEKSHEMPNDVEVNWSDHANKLLLVSGGELTEKSIYKIEDKCDFLR